MQRNKSLPLQADKASAGLELSNPPGRQQPATPPVQKTIIPSPQQSASEAQWRRAGLPRLFSIRAVAAGLDVSEKTVHRWIANGSLPHHRIGRQIRIAEHDLRVILADGRRG
jgi:excisionase family DNA binding protein